ncbi:MAG TPA: PD-(D/E)XK nuclease family protein [Paenalcaligenes sp.]|nr:PD-(D/E)XK nuclease family protein [Paenalcaligenes sp.]
MASIPLETIDQHELLQLAPEKTQIITVNNRFARRVLGFFQQRLEETQRAMVIAEVLPINAWLRRCEEDLIVNSTHMPAAYVLDAFSAVQVWEEVIRQSDANESPLIDIVQAAKLSYEADRLLDEWSIEVKELEQNLDHERFLVWRAAYEAYLQAHELDDENRSVNRIIEAFEQAQVPFDAQQIVWVGFHEFSPRLERLQKALQAQAVQQYTLQWPSAKAQSVWQVQADATEHEWQLAAQWAQEQLQHNPQGRYAIVAAELEKYAPFARRVLDHQLDAGWNMAVGRPLSEWPQVRQILTWLDLLKAWRQAWQQDPDQPVVAPKVLGPALLNGAMGLLGMSGPRMDAQWRHEEVLQVSWQQWEQCLKQQTPEFYARWTQVWSQIQEAPQHEMADGWVRRIREWLPTLGLPGQKNIDSVTYQVLQAFEERLVQFAQYGLALGQMSFGQAIYIFKRLCQEVLFQPERDPEARLDVLGMLEAEGGRWDGVWVLGLTDQVFPAVPKPNPFIPFSALARHQAPRSTPEREFEWAKISFNQLQCSAPEVWFSAPQFAGEEALRPSPLISGFEHQERSLASGSEAILQCEIITDCQAPAVDVQQENLRGGSALIETFARNPQWAFVRYRLQAQGLPDYARLSRSHVLGSLIHALLERLWQGMSVPTRDGLQQWLHTPYAQQTLDALSVQLQQELLDGFPPEIKELLGHWAGQVTMQWLHFEAQREEGFTCIAAEQQARLQIDELVLNLRIDRVDELPDGRLLLIDYKTGLSAKLPSKEWLRPRPIELQLPMYAGFLQEQQRSVAGMAIAKVNAVTPGLDGLGEQVLQEGFKDYDDSSMDWSDQLIAWQEYIEQLGTQLLAGDAQNVIHVPTDYEYCDALPFLRITTQGEHYEQ